MLSINNTTEGYLKNVEIKGNTIQDANNLADIRSVGDKVEGQELYEIPLLCVGKNLFDKDKTTVGTIDWATGTILPTQIDRNYSDFIKCTYPNITVSYSVASGRNGIFEYDSTLKFIKSTQITSQSKIISLDNKTVYIRTQSELNCDVQLEYGTQATPYEPYKEHKLTILSPVQLEKVGDVADRIVEKDGIWGVEKNIVNKIFNGNENWSLSTGDSIGIYKYCTLIKGINDTIENLPKFINNYCKSGNPYASPSATLLIIDGSIRIRTTDNTDEDLQVFKTKLANNNLIIKYVTNNPQFIPLPHSQQVKLRTFANKTNISFLCDVEGTIKASVPKSLGATVNTHTTQIDSLNRELDRVKKLEESTVSTVVTESDFTVVEETSNGYFEDVELKGRTLVNRFNTTSPISEKADTFDRYFTIPIEVGNIYTFTNMCNRKVYLNLDKESGGWYKTITVDSNSSVKIVENVKCKIGNILGKKSEGWTVENKEDLKTHVFLEGDHTQNPPSYFEGLKSAGDGTDEIVVSTVNENLFDGNFVKGYINPNNGSIATSENGRIIPMLKVSPNSTLSVNIYEGNCDRQHFACFDANKNCIRVDVSKGIANTKHFVLNVPSDTHYMHIYIGQDINNLVTKASVTVGTTPKPYTPHKTDKKKLLYFDPADNTWKKPILDEFSTVKKGSDGVYRYYKRGEKLVLNGSETVSIYKTHTNTISFYMRVSDISQIFNTVFSDKFSYIQAGYDIDSENISKANSNDRLYINISKSKLPTPDVAGFKALLKQWYDAGTPCTVLYQTATEKVYECTDLDLITYENETNYMVKSGVLSPKSTLKVHNNIANVVSLLQKKVSLLESNISSYMITQNRLQLNSTYSADQSNFKIDVAVMEGREFEAALDYDLLRLIKHNVLVGKDNYDRAKIEEMLDFYVSLGKIDYDMWDEIWMIMELQDNPPFEEVP